MKKYELTNTMVLHDGKKLHKIRALRDFGQVKKGDIGGFVESESNLSHYGDCWVFGDAKVYEKARVFNDAFLYDEACASGDARFRINQYDGVT